MHQKLTWGPYTSTKYQVAVPAGVILFNGKEHFVPEQVLASYKAGGAADAALQTITAQQYAVELVRMYYANEILTKVQIAEAETILASGP